MAKNAKGSGGQKRRTKRTKDGVPGEAGAPETGDNSRKMSEADRQELFVKSHLPAFVRAENEVQAEKKKQADVVAAAKNDGFTKKQLQLAHAMSDPKGVGRARADVECILEVGKFMGAWPKVQLDLFAEETVPIVDRAYEDGKRMSMEGKPPDPEWAKGTPEYDAYMQGYRDDQDRQAGAVGRGKSDDAAIPRGEVTSGQPMSRKDWETQMQKTTELPPTNGGGSSAT